MSGAAEFAGRLNERMTITRPVPDRDPLGGWTGGWATVGAAWGWVEPAQSLSELRASQSGDPMWRVTLRPTGLLIGDRILWGAETLRVRRVRADPALPDRIIAIAEQEEGL